MNYDANLQAGIVYAATLAGHGSDVATLAGQLFDMRTLLSRAAAAQLALSLHAQGTAVDEACVRAVLADLTSAAALSATGTHWDEPSFERYSRADREGIST